MCRQIKKFFLYVITVYFNECIVEFNLLVKPIPIVSLSYVCFKFGFLAPTGDWQSGQLSFGLKLADKLVL